MSDRIKIGISGQKGSFSEQAAEYYCHMQKITDHELVYLVSVENVLIALDEKMINLAIFPIENSTGGIVEETIYAMSRHIFNIKAKFEIDIKHNLMIKKGVKASEIKKITSHQQALRQCRMYLRRVWPDIEIEEYADTAKAAADLSADLLGATTAVIAPRRCAELYDLDILEEGIQDLKFNFTLFLVGESC